MASKRFRVALSFPGAKRAYVRQVADALARQFGEEVILYDRFHTAEFAVADLAFKLPALYRDESDLIVVFLSGEYAVREWCGLEWRAIYSYIKEGDPKLVMLFRADDAEISGLFGLEGFVPLDAFNSQEAVTLILQRLARNEQRPRDYYLDPQGAPRKDSAEDVRNADPQPGVAARWEVGVFDEIGPLDNSFELHVEYPVFQVDRWDLINTIERGFAAVEVARFRGQLASEKPVAGLMPSFLTGAFSVLYFDPSIISVRHSFSRYKVGGAHPFQETVTRTYAQDPALLIDWSLLFTDLRAALEAISNFSVRALEQLVVPPLADPRWIRRGAGPELDNYQKWNITPSGLLVTFDQYAVAPYAAGRQQVFVPYATVSQWATPLLAQVAEASRRR